MFEYKNNTRGPIQAIVRSRTEVAGSGSRSFTTLVIPGVGCGNNVYLLDDERHLPEYAERLERAGMMSVRHVPNQIRKED